MKKFLTKKIYFLCAVLIVGHFANSAFGQSQQWVRAVGGDANGSPAIGADGTVYITSTDGKLYAINPNGQASHNWAVDLHNTSGQVLSSPTIGVDGAIYVSTVSDTLIN